jgi:signal transduction histidine kinase
MTSILRRMSDLLGSGPGRERVFGVAAATAAVAVCTGVVSLLKQVAPADTLGVVYVVAVLLVSTIWGVWLGLLSALESILAFDYFVLAPVGSLSLRHGSDWVALATFVVAATIGGTIPRFARSRADLIASRARIIAASDEVRKRIARDLHDGAQQRLVTTILNLKLADQEYDRDPQSARELLRAALTESSEGLTELRNLAHGLHPRILTDRGLAEAVAALAARIPLPISVDIRDARYPPHVEAAVYFFIAEALTNVVKHAQASHAEVKVHEADGLLLIDIGDDGVGGADLTGGGIRGITDRIDALGGHLRVESPPGQGTRLRATIAQPQHRPTAPLIGRRPAGGR